MTRAGQMVEYAGRDQPGGDAKHRGDLGVVPARVGCAGVWVRIGWSATSTESSSPIIAMFGPGLPCPGPSLTPVSASSS
ncbi:MAG: hypothetical protein R2849_00850 [Thermomicrobiales bacterium]